jgi:hypothetical protein
MATKVLFNKNRVLYSSKLEELQEVARQAFLRPLSFRFPYYTLKPPALTIREGKLYATSGRVYIEPWGWLVYPSFALTVPVGYSELVLVPTEIEDTLYLDPFFNVDGYPLAYVNNGVITPYIPRDFKTEDTIARIEREVYGDYIVSGLEMRYQDNQIKVSPGVAIINGYEVSLLNSITLSAEPGILYMSQDGTISRIGEFSIATIEDGIIIPTKERYIRENPIDLINAINRLRIELIDAALQRRRVLLQNGFTETFESTDGSDVNATGYNAVLNGSAQPGRDGITLEPAALTLAATVNVQALFNGNDIRSVTPRYQVNELAVQLPSTTNVSISASRRAPALSVLPPSRLLLENLVPNERNITIRVDGALIRTIAIEGTSDGNGYIASSTGRLSMDIPSGSLVEAISDFNVSITVPPRTTPGVVAPPISRAVASDNVVARTFRVTAPTTLTGVKIHTSQPIRGTLSIVDAIGKPLDRERGSARVVGNGIIEVSLTPAPYLEIGEYALLIRAEEASSLRAAAATSVPGATYTRVGGQWVAAPDIAFTLLSGTTDITGYVEYQYEGEEGLSKWETYAVAAIPPTTAVRCLYRLPEQDVWAPLDPVVDRLPGSFFLKFELVPNGVGPTIYFDRSIFKIGNVRRNMTWISKEYTLSAYRNIRVILDRYLPNGSTIAISYSSNSGITWLPLPEGTLEIADGNIPLIEQDTQVNNLIPTVNLTDRIINRTQLKIRIVITMDDAATDIPYIKNLRVATW